MKCTFKENLYNEKEVGVAQNTKRKKQTISKSQGQTFRNHNKYNVIFILKLYIL